MFDVLFGFISWILHGYTFEAEQDEGLEKLEDTVISTKHIALAVNEELDLHTRLIVCVSIICSFASCLFSSVTFSLEVFVNGIEPTVILDLILPLPPYRTIWTNMWKLQILNCRYS